MKLTDGRKIEVKPFRIGQLPALTKAIARIAREVDWSILDDLTLSEAGMTLLEVAPDAVAPFMAIASGLNDDEISDLPLPDGVKIVNAIFDVNDIDQIVRLIRDFFSRIAEVRKKMTANSANRTPTSSLSES